MSSNVADCGPVLMRQNHFGLDLVRCVATILVVCTHTNGLYFFNPASGILSSDWLLSASLASFSRICVPLFLLLSGALLLKADIKLPDFLRKRLPRLVRPLVFWSLFYWAYRVTIQGDRIGLLSALRLFYNAEVFYHLWFL